MDLIQDTKEMVTGTYRASVQIDNVEVDIRGRFELPNNNSKSALDLGLELAIKNSIKIVIVHSEYDAQPDREVK